MSRVVISTRDFDDYPFSTPWSYLTDKDGQACKGTITQFDDTIVCVSPHRTFSLNALIEVPAFGKVVLRTNVIKPDKKKINLLDAFVQGRIDQINNEIHKENSLIPRKILQDFHTIVREKNTLQKLSKLMFLGEKIVLTAARKKLDLKIRSGVAKNIKMGGQAFGIQRGRRYAVLHERLYDLGVAPLYFFLLKGISQKHTDWTLTDQIVNWLMRQGKIVKGHPLIWLHKYALPEWMKNLNFKQLKKFLTTHVTEVVNRYKDRIKIWDITNEFATADANGFDLTIEQLLEILALVSRLVKKLQPDAHRIINFTDIWAAGGFVHGKPTVPPVYFLNLCKKRGVEFDAIGLQFYMGLKKDFTCRELLNINQTIDEFVHFGKPIHFSEMGFPSKHDVDPGCFFSSDHPAAGGFWHRPWDEKLQADFLAKLLTLYASKPNVLSIIWWDMTDNGEGQDVGSRFLTFSGLSRRDFSLKPAAYEWLKFKKRLLK